MATAYVGEIRPVPYNFAPDGWAFCDGSILSIAQNEVLFNLIGTTFGGDGQQTFALPDLRGRVPISFGTGPGLSPYVLGEFGGVENVTLNLSQVPQHTHGLASTANPAISHSPAEFAPALAARELYATGASPDTHLAGLNGAGGNQPHENRQPYLAINYIISLFGVYPSQG